MPYHLDELIDTIYEFDQHAETCLLCGDLDSDAICPVGEPLMNNFLTVLHASNKTIEEEVLQKLRSVLNNIHQGGNIYYDKDRKEAYAVVAKLASEIRAGRINVSLESIR